jgi:hypothetical protein
LNHNLSLKFVYLYNYRCASLFFLLLALLTVCGLLRCSQKKENARHRKERKKGSVVRKFISAKENHNEWGRATGIKMRRKQGL